MAEYPQGAAGQATPDYQKPQLDPNTSMKTEYMSFPPPLQRSPLNTTTESGYGHRIYLGRQLFTSPSLFMCLFSLFPSDQVVGWNPPLQTTPSSITNPKPSPRSQPPPHLLSPPTTPNLNNLTGHHRRASVACLILPTPQPSQRRIRLGGRPLRRPTLPPEARRPARVDAEGAKGITRTAKVSKPMKPPSWWVVTS